MTNSIDITEDEELDEPEVYEVSGCYCECNCCTCYCYEEADSVPYEDLDYEEEEGH